MFSIPVFATSIVSILLSGSFLIAPFFGAQPTSVEFNLAEVSPAGEKGGFAVPASGSSDCGLVISPSTISQGGQVTLTWDSPNAASLGVYRYTDATNYVYLGMRQSPFVDTGAASLPVGSYNYTLWGYWDYAIDHNLDSIAEWNEYRCGAWVNITGPTVTCSANKTTAVTGEQVTWTAVPSGGTAPYTYQWKRGNGESLGTGNPLVFTYTDPGPKNAQVILTDSNGVQSAPTTCSNSVTVTQSLNYPDLISQNIAKSGGGTTITANQAVTFTATARNQTAYNAGAFKDSFSYGYGGVGGSFTPITTINVSSLNGNTSRTDTSSSIAFATPGTVTIKHCVDIENTVTPETDESNNCSYQDFVVGSATSITASCSASPNPIEEGDSATWSASISGGTPPHSYQWQGTNSLSGSTATVNKTYTTEGTKTAQVKVTDSVGLTSGWIACTNLVVTDNSTPQCDVVLRGRVIGDAAWSTNSIDISETEEVELQWTVTGNNTQSLELGYTNSGGSYTSMLTDNSSPFSGSTQTVSEPANGSQYQYRARCATSAGSEDDTFTVRRGVTIAPPTITVDPSRVRINEVTYITTDLNGHTNCTITGRSVNASDPNSTLLSIGSTNLNNRATAPILGETTYELSCTSGGTAEATVRILPAFEHI